MSERVKQVNRLKKPDLVRLVLAYEDEIVRLEEQVTQKTVIVTGTGVTEDIVVKFLRERLRVVADDEKREKYEEELDRLLP